MRFAGTADHTIKFFPGSCIIVELDLVIPNYQKANNVNIMIIILQKHWPEINN